MLIRLSFVLAENQLISVFIVMMIYEKQEREPEHATVCVSCGYHFYYAAHNSTTILAAELELQA
jgi:hypothetical protein